MEVILVIIVFLSAVELLFAEPDEELLEKAKACDVDAQFKLGLMYAKGEGVKQSYKEAVWWFRLAAAQGSARAQYNLGLIYYTGETERQIQKEEEEWWKSDDEDSFVAQYTQNLLDFYDEEVVQSYKKAAKWFKLAAERGIAEAQYNLGTMYANGESVKQDHEQAYFWFLVASTNANKELYELASNSCNLTAGQLSTDQRDRIQKAAAAWKPKD